MMPNTYYVRKTGSDAAAGTSAGAAWLTIDKAANTVSADDIVYIGAGVYHELVTMDTSGSSGSPIQFVADIDGSQTGDPGLVFISAYDDDVSAVVRTMCLDMNAQTFIEWHNVQFIGGSSQAVGNTANASHIAYEGCVFDGCLFQMTQEKYAFQIEINNGKTPTADGLTMTNCRFLGAVKIHWDSNGTSHYNLKWRFENCFFLAAPNTVSSSYGYDMRRIANGGANTVGGIKHVGCMFLACEEAIYYSNLANTTNVSYVDNCRFILCAYGVDNQSGTAGTVVIQNSLASACTNKVGTGVTWPFSLSDDSSFYLAGLHDAPMIGAFGWSPYGHAFTPIVSSAVTDPGVDFGGDGFDTETVDMYGNPRQMGSPTTGLIYYFDGSDDSITDPNSAWINDGNLLTTSITDEVYTSGAVGSSSSNYLHAGGTNAPSSGGTISGVECRIINYVTGGALGTLEVYTDALGESLGTVTLDKSTGSPVPASLQWSDWTALSTPSGGWTWAKIQALEFKLWKSQAGTYVSSSLIEIRVTVAEAGIDIGPVEANPRGARSATWVDAGTYSMAFTSTGYHDFWRPVNAESTTIQVSAYKDASYAGAQPKMEVFIGNTSQGSDSMTVGTETKEVLSVNFTPSAAGWARVRLYPYATSGTVFFDELTNA